MNAERNPIGPPAGRIAGAAGAGDVIRADGSRLALVAGLDVRPGDVLATGAGGQATLVFADGARAVLAQGTHLSLAAFEPDSEGHAGRIALAMREGTLVADGGRIAARQGGAMVVETPAAIVEVGDGRVGIVRSDDGALEVAALDRPDGTVGEATVRNGAGEVVLDRADAAAQVAAPDCAPEGVEGADCLLRLHALAGELSAFADLAWFETAAAAADGDPTLVRALAGDYSGRLAFPDRLPFAEPRYAGAAATLAAPTGRRHDPVFSPVPAAQPAPPGEAINEDPVAFDDAAAMREDEAASGRLVATDANRDPLTFALAADGAPAHGSVTIAADGRFTYTPTPDFAGTDRFAYTVDDGRGGTARATVTLTVAPVADPPTLAVSNVTVGSARAGDDVLTGTSGRDTLYGGGGADTLSGLANVDTLYGDSLPPGPRTESLAIAAALGDLDGSETLAVEVVGVPAGTVLSAGVDRGDGTWVLAPGESAGLTITVPEAQALPFTLAVRAIATDVEPASGASDSAVRAANLTVGLAAPGADTLFGGAGNDTLYGEGGDDRLYGEAGADTLWGGEGDDRLEGGTENDTLYGEAGADTLLGGAGNDRLEGGDGDDILIGEAGRDTLYGDAGDDVLYGDFTDGSGVDADTLYGGAGNDRLYGGGGADILRGGDGDDLLLGEAGDDRLYGDAGADRLEGGEGADRLYGGDDADTLLGGAGDDILDGEAGNDVLYGGDGADTLRGGAGDDTLHGEAGNDSLAGGAGNDAMRGGAGDDTLDGGTGSGDVAIFSGLRDDYDLSRSGTRYTVVDTRTGAETEGTDTVRNTEFFRFADGTWSTATVLDPDAPPTMPPEPEAEPGYQVTPSGPSGSPLTLDEDEFA